MHREICVKGFIGTIATRILKFGTNIGYVYAHSRCEAGTDCVTVQRLLITRIHTVPVQKELPIAQTQIRLLLRVT